jgi:hypothetical protein
LALTERPVAPVAVPSLVTLTLPPSRAKAPIAVPAAVIDDAAPVVTVTSPVPQSKASMPKPASAMMVALLWTSTLPATPLLAISAAPGL